MMEDGIEVSYLACFGETPFLRSDTQVRPKPPIGIFSVGAGGIKVL